MLKCLPAAWQYTQCIDASHQLKVHDFISSSRSFLSITWSDWCWCMDAIYDLMFNVLHSSVSFIPILDILISQYIVHNQIMRRRWVYTNVRIREYIYILHRALGPLLSAVSAKIFQLRCIDLVESHCAYVGICVVLYLHVVYNKRGISDFSKAFMG